MDSASYIGAVSLFFRRYFRNIVTVVIGLVWVGGVYIRRTEPQEIFHHGSIAFSALSAFLILQNAENAESAEVFHNKSVSIITVALLALLHTLKVPKCQ